MRIRPLYYSLFACAVLSACAPRSPSVSKVDGAVARFRAGEVVAAVSDAPTASPSSLPEPVGSVPEFAPALPAPEACPELAVLPSGATEEEFSQAIGPLADCLNGLLREPLRAYMGLDFLRQLEPDDAAPLSTRKSEELDEFFQSFSQQANDGGRPVEFLVSHRRRRFSDPMLEDLRALAKRWTGALALAEGQAIALLRKHAALVDRAAAQSARWKILALLRDDLPPEIAESPRLAQQIAPVLQKEGLWAGEPRQVEMLRPYLLQAVVPDRFAPLGPLQAREHPFRMAKEARGYLNGPAEIVQSTIDLYRKLRDADNPPLPAHDVASEQAVRMAMMDTGIDFLRFPDLGLFLGQGGDRELAQGDFADRDLNPYADASLTEFKHGSGTAATVLTLLAHQRPELLRARRLDLAMWKLHSVRQVLTGFGDVNWNSTPGFETAVVANVNTRGRQPQVVSVSLSFHMHRFLAEQGRIDVIARAPWLWVMAAGNQRSVVGDSAILPACLSDMKERGRKADHILCVGALRRGIVNDAIASYSNFGPDVDVYTYDTYSELCPSGTSCATPAVAAATVAILDAQPSLSVPEVRRAILDVAEMRELVIEPIAPALQLPFVNFGAPTLDRRPVRVFDPATMLERALTRAAEIAASHQPPLAKL